jgi:uncharacterized Zn-finger protein
MENLCGHPSVKPFVCNYSNCNKTFSLGTNLNLHIERHLVIKKYKRNYNECDMSFVTSNELNAHISRKHKI